VNPSTPTIMTPMLPVARASARCTLFGHRVHHTRIASDAGTACARCGAAILDQDYSVSRVTHTLSCFFGRHHYVPIARRAAHHEYVCEKCGHPLLFELARDPYAGHGKFKKRVNYACGLFGHRVHVVAAGLNATEYACRCGHSFVKTQRALTVIRHPLACVLLGHFVTFNEIRGEWAEYICRRCGHPFCFSLAAFGPLESDLEQRPHV
jgi:DNA-directed RNA polymerase subunit RPC12/RpoP